MQTKSSDIITVSFSDDLREYSKILIKRQILFLSLLMSDIVTILKASHARQVGHHAQRCGTQSLEASVLLSRRQACAPGTLKVQQKYWPSER